MGDYHRFRLVAFLLAGSAALLMLQWSQAGRPSVQKRLAYNVTVEGIQTQSHDWGIRVSRPPSAPAQQHLPVRLEFTDGKGEINKAASGYRSLKKGATGFIGQAEITNPEGVLFRVEDQWESSGPVVNITRKVTVKGNQKGGFASSVTLAVEEIPTVSGLDYFAPGMVYGGTDRMEEIPGRGGPPWYGVLQFRSADGAVRIREDRFPAPLLGIRFKDGSSLAVLDPKPRGSTTAADGQDDEGRTLVDERFQFGALGVVESGEELECGYWFPGSETQVNYRSQATPKPAVVRRRYHPIKDGFAHVYQVSFRFGQKETFPVFYRNAWRWAWATLKPAVNYHDIDVVRRSLIDMLAERVETHDGRAGITNAVTAAADEIPRPDRKAIMGFTGKNLESAVFLLADADQDRTPRGVNLRKLALAIIDSFLRLKVDPPEGEGFNLDTGRAELALPRENKVFLRSFTDDMKMLLKAYQREKSQGREHPAWLRWCQAFADWLLGQQRADGGFPRTWRPGTGEVIDAEPESSYNAIPMLVLLGQETGQRKYLDAALLAGEFCWGISKAKGRFVGGTIDNPNVIDKEAGTLSLEAYLVLYEATRDRKWLNRAKVAADFSETWVYIWNVPMAEDEDDSKLHWKRGVSTVGVNTINSTESAVDQYMAFDADEFAKLYVYTRDSHYFDVSRILLHNTKNMLALPGRTFDLNGPGWQQEHWRMAWKRGYGHHRLWLPWVSTSHLNGIFGLEDFDPVLFKKLARRDSAL